MFGDICGGHLLEHLRRLARQHRFVHRQVRRLVQQQVGRHAVAFGQQHGVADHQVAPGDAARRAATLHQCAWAGQITQGLHRALAAPLLHKADDHHDEHKAQQHQRFMAVAQHQVEPAARHQQQEHGLKHHVAQQVQHAALPGRRQLVRAVSRQALKRLGFAQAFSGRGRGQGHGVCRASTGVWAGASWMPAPGWRAGPSRRVPMPARGRARSPSPPWARRCAARSTAACAQCPCGNRCRSGWR